MDITKIRRKLGERIRHHHQEQLKHQKLYFKNGCSKRQREKKIKHMHKLHELLLFAKELGVEYCPCCGRLGRQEASR